MYVLYVTQVICPFKKSGKARGENRVVTRLTVLLVVLGWGKLVIWDENRCDGWFYYDIRSQKKQQSQFSL